MANAVAEMDKRLAAPSPMPSIRDLPNAALAKLMLGQVPGDAEKLVDLAFAQQDMNEKSKDFGMVPWQIGHPEIHDANAIEFATQAIGPMLIAYGDKLSPRFKKDLEPHIRAAFAAMDRRNFKTPAYTNIFLMRAVSMILMGEAIGDNKAADTGYAQLDAWIGYTREAGIHEFDSPTYYCTDLNSLTIGYLYASRPGARAKFKAILDYFWTDIAANFFVANGCLSGPHSRNYDFLRSWGGLDLFLYAEGFCNSDHVPKPDLEKIYLLLVGDAKAYHPPQGLYDLAAEPQRVIESRSDTDASRTRYNFITPEFAIGSASGGDYGQQDKLIGVEVASTRKLPVMAIIPDAFDAPYGRFKTPDGSGHDKPTHLRYRPVAVQSMGVMLALLDVDAGDAPQTRSIATNVLLPAAADAITLDSRRVPMTDEFEKPAPLNSVIGVREGKAGVAIRVFQAQGLAGQEAVSLLKADAAGLKDGVARLAIYHYRGDPRTFAVPGAKKGAYGPPIRVGLIMAAAHCDSDADFDALLTRVREAKVESTEAKDIWHVEATVGKVSLDIARDQSNMKIEHRRVDGKDIEAHQLEVNGEDLAARVWATLPRAD
jgi:hypothetical protein